MATKYNLHKQGRNTYNSDKPTHENAHQIPVASTIENMDFKRNGKLKATMSFMQQHLTKQNRILVPPETNKEKFFNRAPRKQKANSFSNYI